MNTPARAIGRVRIVKSNNREGKSFDLFTEWEMKERLLSSARAHAEATGLRIVAEDFNGFEFALPDSGLYVSLLEFRHRVTAEFPYILRVLGAPNAELCRLEFCIREVSSKNETATAPSM